ncbi:hypothetical protein HD806DRAFT_493050 [Xylariaceae sp. AK1471]|nr:hypothetical protein HD806DRAFT_493050 [Xylariaceae sp. AK1471]
MASAVTDPTASLQAALGEFQSMLSAEDRQKLEQIKGKPAADAAIQFTASLDRDNAAKRKGPSISSRLYSVLLSVQQFSSVLDTFVSSNPAIAALVWGTVKLTMMVVTNFLTYYEEVSKAFINFDKWSPRFSEYKLLFPSSIRLQAAICEFHASIIRCCKQVVQMLQRSWQSQLVNSLTKSFQSEIEDQIRLIKDRAREVSFEVELAKAQSDYQEQQQQARERASASSHRLALTSFISLSNAEITEAQRWRETLDRQKKAENYQRLLDEISTFDHVSAFNLARSKRYHSTGSWVFQTHEWSNWEKADKSRILWLSGKIGAGKTVLSATIVDHLLVSRRASESISFFFPRFDHAESLLADTIIRSLIRQNLQPDLVAKLSDALTKASSSFYSQDSVLKLLVSKLAFFSTNYILIDALDECEPKERQKLLQMLGAAVNTSSSIVKIFVSSRDSLENEMLTTLSQVTKIRMDAPEAVSDLELFTRQSLSERMNMGQLAIGSIVSLERICDALTTKAQGMFLWVALEIDDICSQVCEEDILVVLRNLPATLTDIFTRALIRILRQGNQRIAKDVFKWVSVAKRPMLIGELQEALTIRLGESYSKPQRRPQRIKNLPVWCANLVEIDDISNSVQFVHHTVLTFLVDTSIINSNFPELDEFHNSLEDLDTSAGELCVTYLEWNDFRTALEPFKAPFKQTIIAPEPGEMIKVALNNEWRNAAAAKISHLVLQPKQRSNKVLEYPGLMSVVGNQKQARGDSDSRDRSHPFLEYAATYWIMHTRLLPSHSPVYWPWKRMLTGDHHIAKTPWAPQELQSSILKWACNSCHLAIFDTHMSSDSLTLSQLHEYSCSMVAESRSIWVLKKCLSNIVDFAPSYWTEDMLLRMKIETVASYLLSPEDIDLARQTQQWSIFKMYRPEMMHWNDQWDINAIADNPGLLELAYYASVQWGLAGLMSKLVTIEPSLCDVPDCVDIQPLEVAVMTEKIFVVSFLLYHGRIDPNQSCSGYGWCYTPRMVSHFDSLLQLAICKNNPEIINLLIGWEASVNGPNWKQNRLFSTIWSHPRKVNLNDGSGPGSRLALKEAGVTSGRDHEEFPFWAEKPFEGTVDAEIARRGKLEAGLEPHSIRIQTDYEVTWEQNPKYIQPEYNTPFYTTIDVRGLAPLHCAIIVAAAGDPVDSNNLEPMELLLKLGADPNIQDIYGMTPLHLAVSQRHLESIKVLLKGGADTTIISNKREKPWQYASRIRFHQGVQILSGYAH